MNSFSGRTGEMAQGQPAARTALNRGSYSDVLMGKGKRSRVEEHSSPASTENQTQDSSLLSVNTTKNSTAFHKQKKRDAKAARAAAAAANPTILSRQELEQLDKGALNSGGNEASEQEREDEEARLRASALLKVRNNKARGEQQLSTEAKHDPSPGPGPGNKIGNRRQEEHRPAITEAEQPDNKSHGAVPGDPPPPVIGSNEGEVGGSNPGEQEGDRPDQDHLLARDNGKGGISRRKLKLNPSSDDGEGGHRGSELGRTEGIVGGGGGPRQELHRSKSQDRDDGGHQATSKSKDQEGSGHRATIKSKSKDDGGHQVTIVDKDKDGGGQQVTAEDKDKEGSGHNVATRNKGKDGGGGRRKIGLNQPESNDEGGDNGPGLTGTTGRAGGGDDDNSTQDQRSRSKSNGSGGKRRNLTAKPKEEEDSGGGSDGKDQHDRRAIDDAPIDESAHQERELGRQRKPRRKDENDRNDGKHPHPEDKPVDGNDGGGGGDGRDRTNRRAAGTAQSGNQERERGSQRKRRHDEDDDGDGNNGGGHGSRSDNDPDGFNNARQHAPRQESSNGNDEAGPAASGQFSSPSKEKLMPRQQLSSIGNVDSSPGDGFTAAAQGRNLSPSDDGGMGYTTDDSGDRKSKLARRERLRQKIMARVGCSYEDAKLMLAEADTGRLVEGTYRFRGDAWRLDRACELWTSRTMALKAEQRAKWTAEVKLAAGCEQQMASLAVSVAEAEPSLVRNGRLEAARLVKWAVEWVEERRRNRRTADSYYEESAVQMMRKEKASEERAERSRAAPVGLLVASKSPEPLKVGLTQQAMMVLLQNDCGIREVFPPLDEESELVKEMARELQQEVQSTYGAAAELSFRKAYLALEASRYEGQAQGWPTVEGALGCLQVRKQGSRSAEAASTQGGGKAAGAGQSKEKEQLAAGAQGDGNVAGAGQSKEKEQLLLTREALSLLGRVERGELEQRVAMVEGEGELEALVSELVEVAGRVHGEAVATLSRERARTALDAGRYLSGVGGDQPTVANALRCLQNCGHKELWQIEVDQIAQRTGMDLTDAWGARGRAMRADPGTTDVVALAVEMDKEAKRMAAEKSRDALGGGGREGRRGKGNRRMPNESDSGDESGGTGKNARGEERSRMPPLDLLERPNGIEPPKENNPNEKREEKLSSSQQGKGAEEASKGAGQGEKGTEPSGKRQRTKEPLPRGLRRTLAQEEERVRSNAATRKDGIARGEGLDRRQQSKVWGRGMSAEERELARHAARSKAAERARCGRQEDMQYALDAFRRQQQGEVLTAVEQEWAELGATLSPARVLGYGAGATAEQEADQQQDEFEGMLDAILEQYDCDEDEAAEALEATADEEGWNLDAAISWLVDAGVEPWREDGERGQYSDASEDCSEGDSEAGARGRDAPTTPQSAESQRGRAASTGGTDRAETEGGLPVLPKNSNENLQSASTPRSQPAPWQLRYRARSNDPNERAKVSTDQDRIKSDGIGHESPSRRISAAGTIHNLRGHEFLVRQLQRVISCDDATARLLLMDKRARDDSRTVPDVAKAVKLYYEGLKEGKTMRGDLNAVEAETSKLRTAAGTLHSMVLPSLTLPDWDVGKAPDGGFSYPTFRRIYALFQKYQRQTNFATTVTLKSLVTAQLRPTIEARCGFGKDAWKETGEGGLDDSTFIQRVQETLKPVRATEFEVLFEGMKLKHPGNETDILATVEEWGEKWLSTEREAEEQGILLHSGRMKELFKKAVAPIARVSRLILGETFKSTAEWYTLIVRELRLRQSYAAEADRDGRKRESFYGGSPRGGGRGGVGRGRFFNSRPTEFDSAREGADDVAQHNNHSGGTEPMTYQPSGRGRGGGDFSPRGRGRGQGAGRGQGGRSYHQGENPDAMAGRGDRKGAGWNASQFGHRQPINDPKNENPNALPRGKWWHDSSQVNLCCRSPDCGSKQEVPFCQGCGQHHHGREWCYKKNDEGFNATGYWSENRKGREPLRSRDGRAWGAPPARANHMDGGEQGNSSGQGLA
jgi:hypothetical protein